MAITNSAGKIQSGLSSAFTGGSVPSGNVIIDVSDWADPLEPRRTPVLSRCKKGPTAKQIKTEWGQSYHTAVTGTIAEALDSSETAIDLTSGQGLLMQPWLVLEVIDYVSGTTRLDPSTREEIVVKQSDGTDTIPLVQRGAGGTSAVSHSNGAYWAVCGVALPYATDFEMSPFTRGDRLFNYSQRFYGMVGGDNVGRQIADYENKTDVMLKDLKKETLKQKWMLERALVSGGRQAGDANGIPTSTTQTPFKMGGLDYFITNHSGRVTNMGGATLSFYDLEDVLADMYKEIDDGGAKTLLMSVDTARIFDSVLNPIREATIKDDSVNLTVSTVKFRWGTVEIEATQHLPDNMILFVDFKDIMVRPMPGANWSTEDLPTQGPYAKKAIWGEFTAEFHEITRCGKLWNFNGDLAAYPRREFF